MRLGLLGPSDDDPRAIERAARFLMETVRPDRVVYLGADGRLEPVVASWARELVGADPSDQALWSRAAQVCLDADSDTIGRFIASERARLALRVLESLPDEQTRSIELLSGRVAVLIHDKSHLDEEDMLPASLLVYGKSSAPVVKQIGNRWFLSPGSLPLAGVMVLEDTEEGIQLDLFDAAGKRLQSTPLATPRAAKMRVSTA